MKRRGILKGIGAGTLAVVTGTGAAAAMQTSADGDGTGPSNYPNPCNNVECCSDCPVGCPCDDCNRYC